MGRVNVFPVAALLVVCVVGCIPAKKLKVEKYEYRTTDTLRYHQKDSVLLNVLEQETLKSTLYISRVEYFRPDSTGRQYVKQRISLSSGIEQKVGRDSVSVVASDIVFTKKAYKESLDARVDKKSVSPFFWLACILFLTGMGYKICSWLKKL